MELAFYNAVLTAISTDGRKYTYVNQLASSDVNPAERSEWFRCACCPPNIMRTLAIIGGYLYSQPASTEAGVKHIAVHLYSSSTLGFTAADHPSTLTQSTDWPWSGDVEFKLDTSCKAVSISLRIPQWASDWSVSHHEARTNKCIHCKTLTCRRSNRHRRPRKSPKDT